MELLKRSITGILYVAAIVASIILGDKWMFWLFAACTVLVTIEFVSLINRHKDCNASWFCAATLSFFLYSGITAFITGLAPAYTVNPIKLLLPFIVYFILTIIWELYQQN
ncbi:MAG: hypothetical protein J6Q97_05895, partial [Bacteroidaceae bacterium]|nr:hypothetical protein [Bacteroidaceae bacterium]